MFSYIKRIFYMSKSLDLDTEVKVIDSVNSKKKTAIKSGVGFAKQSVAGSVRITDSVSSDKADEIKPEAQESVTPEPVKDEAEKPSPVPANPFTADDLKALLTNAVQSAVEPIKAELDSVKSENKSLAEKLNDASSKVEETKTQLDEAAVKASILEDLGKLFGKSVDAVPMINRTVTSKSDKPEGILKEYFDVADRTPQVTKMSDAGVKVVVRDNSELDRLVKENKTQLIRDLESYGKANGLMKGGRVMDSATVSGDIPGGFLEVLSAIMRQNNRPGFVFHQFPVTKIEFNRGEGDTIKIPRAAFLPTPSNPDDRLLSGSGTYFPIDSSNQNLSTGTCGAIVQEWGLGKNAQYPPVGIPQFVSAYSMIDLMAIVERNLMYDYYFWEDQKIRSLWKTSRVVYNDKNRVTTSVGDLGANDLGTCTEAFLTQLYAYMRTLLIPTYMDGCYGLVLNSIGAAQLKGDLSTRYFYPTDASIRDLTNILNPTAGGEVDKISGYLGRYANFHIWESNAFGVGGANTEGVRSETVNSVAQLTRSNYAFGADTIGRGIASEMSILTDEVTQFGRMKRFIWREESGFVAMDVDPTAYSDLSTVPQQLRVIEFRNVSTPV